MGTRAPIGGRGPASGRAGSGRVAVALLAAASLGCAAIVSSATRRLSEDLTTASLNQNDPATVRDGAPAFLLMIDGLIAGSPDDVDLLLAGARLYGAYVGAFVQEPVRAKRLADKARSYGRRALCARDRDLCDAVGRPFEEFEAALAEVDASDLPALYGFATASAVWIQAHSDDWNAIAELPRVEGSLRRVVELDDAHDGGNAHLYLAVMGSLLSPNLGGKPEVARVHFERAIAISDGRNLQAKLLYAERYARLVFDRELHDRLLTDVLEADPVAPGLTLGNILAQERAAVLLEESPEYF